MPHGSLFGVKSWPAVPWKNEATASWRAGSAAASEKSTSWPATARLSFSSRSRPVEAGASANRRRRSMGESKGSSSGWHWPIPRAVDGAKLPFDSTWWVWIFQPTRNPESKSTEMLSMVRRAFRRRLLSCPSSEKIR